MKKTMKAIVKKHSEVGIWMDEVPIPTIQDNEVLVKILKTSICGTDLHIYKWDAWARKNVPVPLVIGHEFVGVIEKIGSRVTQYKVGERVTAEGHLVCGVCEPCLEGKKHSCPKTKGIGYHAPGVFAEYAAIPEENVFRLPKEISDEEAAILTRTATQHTPFYLSHSPLKMFSSLVPARLAAWQRLSLVLAVHEKWL